MKKATAILLTLFSTLCLAARLTDGKVVTKIAKNEIRLTVMSGFHFNTEAPASAKFDESSSVAKPSTKTEKSFIYKIPKDSKKAQLSFYVCDDKKTVCEQQQASIDLATSQISQVEKKPLAVNFEKVTSLESVDGKPTLLIFSAPWCPACIRMQTETYPVASVAKELNKIHFKKVNSDLVENFELSEKFHIKAIPTHILLNAKGEEVYRWLDFQPANTFAKSLAAETKKIESSSQSLQVKAAQGDLEAASQLGMREYNSMNCTDAVKWLSISKKPEDRKYKLAAEVNCAENNVEDNKESKEAHLQTLEKAIALTESEWDQIRWLTTLIENKKEAGPLSADMKSKASETVNRIEQLLKVNVKQLLSESTYGEAASFEKEEMLYTKANLQELLELKEDKKKTLDRSVQLLSKRKLSVNRPGEMLIAIAYLREAGEIKKVEALYESLIKKYPSTYVYYEKYARFQHKNKNLEAALALSDKAIAYSEGNDPQLYLLRVRILKDMKQIEKATAEVEKALALKDIEHKRFKKTMAQLKTLKDDLRK